MSSLLSLTQGAYSSINNVKGQSRILEAEIRMDASRGVVITRKQENLEMLKEQEETAMNFLAEAVTQDSENTKKFLDSAKETMDKINEEAKKREEEQAAKNIESTGEAAQSNAVIEENQNTTENGESGTIVDIIIPSTIITNDLPSSNANKDEQDATTVSVSV